MGFLGFLVSGSRSLILVLRPIWSPIELFFRRVPGVVPVLCEPGAVGHSHSALPSWLRPVCGNTISSSFLCCFNLSAHFLMRNGQMVRLPKGHRGKEPSLHTCQGSEPPFCGKLTKRFLPMATTLVSCGMCAGMASLQICRSTKRNLKGFCATEQLSRLRTWTL